MAGKTIVPVTQGLTSTLVVELFESGQIKDAEFAFEASDPQVTADRIRDRELQATTADELFGGGETTSGKDYQHKPFQLTAVEWQPSEIEGEGLPLYAVLHVVTMNGETKVITCGAEGVVRKAAIADAKGFLPQWLKIVSVKTRNDRDALDLVKAAESEIPF
jgi:hypothetical protein